MNLRNDVTTVDSSSSWVTVCTDGISSPPLKISEFGFDLRNVLPLLLGAAIKDGVEKAARPGKIAARLMMVDCFIFYSNLGQIMMIWSYLVDVFLKLSLY